jgi:hypothetical protein
MALRLHQCARATTAVRKELDEKCNLHSIALINIDAIISAPEVLQCETNVLDGKSLLRLLDLGEYNLGLL